MATGIAKMMLRIGNFDVIIRTNSAKISNPTMSRK